MFARTILLIISTFILSACGILELLPFVGDETSIPSTDLAEAPPNLSYPNPNWDLSVNFDLGSSCWTSANMSICVDKIPPEYTAAQHIAVSDEMVLVFAEPFPNTISVSLYPGSNLFASEQIPLETSLDVTGQMLITLPDNLQGNYILAVFATWETSGDAFYTLPITIE